MADTNGSLRTIKGVNPFHCILHYGALYQSGHTGENSLDLHEDGQKTQTFKTHILADVAYILVDMKKERELLS